MATEETCSLQRSIQDEKNGRHIYRTVREFADHRSLGKWHNEFLDSYKIMASNKNTDLVDNDDFLFGNACSCYKSFLDFDTKDRIGRPKKFATVSECQANCREYDDCVGFLYNEKDTRCSIYSELSEPKIGERFTIYGPKTCSRRELRNCNMFEE